MHANDPGLTEPGLRTKGVPPDERSGDRRRRHSTGKTAPPVPAHHFEDANIITALFQLFWKEQPPYYHAHVQVLLGSEQLAGQTATLRMLREGESCGAMQPARAWAPR